MDKEKLIYWVAGGLALTIAWVALLVIDVASEVESKAIHHCAWHIAKGHDKPCKQ